MIERLKFKMDRVFRIALIFGLGFIFGSIFAPFEVRMRSSDALPDMGSGFELPVVEEDIR